MNKLRTQQLKRDLPYKTKQQIELVNKIRRNIENLNIQIEREEKVEQKIEITNKLMKDLSNIQVKYEKLLDNKLETIRTQYGIMKQLDLELPPLLSAEFKDQESKDTYITQLLEDIKNQKETMKERGNKHMKNPLKTTEFLKDVKLETQTLAETIQRAKQEWYKDIDLEPIQTRKNKQKTLQKHINWVTKHLEKSAKTLNQYKSHIVEKDKKTIKTLRKQIHETYINLVNELRGQPEQVIQQHRHKTPNLNTILKNPDRKIQTQGIQNPEPKTQEAIVVNHAINKYKNTKQNTTYQFITQELKQALNSPYKKQIRKIPNEQIETLLKRPTNEDKQRFWKHYLRHLLSSAGKAIPVPQKQEKIEENNV